MAVMALVVALLAAFLAGAASPTISSTEPHSVGLGGGAVLLVHGAGLMSASFGEGKQLPSIMVGDQACPLLLERTDHRTGETLACRYILL